MITAPHERLSYAFAKKSLVPISHIGIFAYYNTSFLSYLTIFYFSSFVTASFFSPSSKAPTSVKDFIRPAIP